MTWKEFLQHNFDKLLLIFIVHAIITLMLTTLSGNPTNHRMAPERSQHGDGSTHHAHYGTRHEAGTDYHGSDHHHAERNPTRP